MSIDAMKQALEALEAYRPVIVKRHGLTYSVGDKAITALRQAIEQAEQAQPVAWWHLEDGATYFTSDPSDDMIGVYWQPLYTAPPQRKPLTDAEISDLWDGHTVPVFGKTGINPIVFARAIEQAHGIKEKNT